MEREHRPGNIAPSRRAVTARAVTRGASLPVAAMSENLAED
jgi:hypothetical protein